MAPVSDTGTGSSGRSRNAQKTHDDLLRAAKERFSTLGYEGTTLRAIAGDVGVDPALVVRYFGSKEELFLAASSFDLHFPNLALIDSDQWGKVLISNFFRIWEQENFLALMRASVSNTKAGEAMKVMFFTEIAPKIIPLLPDHPMQRVALLGSMVLGMAYTRYILETPSMVPIPREELTIWAAPILQQILTGPVPEEIA